MINTVRDNGGANGASGAESPKPRTVQRTGKRLREILEYAAVGIVRFDEQGLLGEANRAFCEIVGCSRRELYGRSLNEIIHPDDRDAAAKVRSDLCTGVLLVHTGEERLLRRDGTVVPVRRTISSAYDSVGRICDLICVAEDVSEVKRAAAALEESEKLLTQLASHIPQAFWIAESSLGRMVYVSPACEALIGVSAERLLANQRLLVRSVHPADRRRVYEQRLRAGAVEFNEVYRIVRPDGTVRWVHDRAFPVRDAVGSVYRIAGIAEDITERKLAEEQLIVLAHNDSLTGLPNRALFFDRVKQALNQSKRSQRMAAVMFFDVDRFKYVNDSLGHAAGDLLLTQIAERLVGCIRAGDTVARLGGDEFAIVLNGLNVAEDAALVAAKIMDALNLAFELESTELFLSASIGITLAPDDGEDPDVLLRQADIAMYRAKALGRKNFQFYKPEMNARTRELLTLERDLRHAIDRDELVVHYQPKLRLDTGRITGLEALIRWQHPQRGLVPPGDFLPVLEETGLIIPAGACVLRAVCRQINEWRSLGLAAIPVAVNLSARQFLSPGLAQSVRDILEEHGVAPSLLELEITESAIMVDPEDAVRTLEYLESLGVAIAIDDFGTGYSSLAYLKRFPLRALKVDRSFVRDITTDPDDAAIAQAVISMAHSLSLRVVAEGVETSGQLEFLKRCGCDEGQGYLFSRPIPGDECGRYIAAHRL